MSNELKFPKGEFTHSTLATFNGRTNQQVWTAFDAARKNNIIKLTRKDGKTGYYELSDPSLATAGAIPIPVVKEKVKVEPVLKEKKAAVAPIVEVLTVEEIRPVVSAMITTPPEETDFLCPHCKTKLLLQNDATGVTLWCPINNLKICPCAENPYGHSNTAKNAYEILTAKYGKTKLTVSTTS
jgi:hypothetical protein